MKKKVLSLLLVGCLLLTAGCGEKESKEKAAKEEEKNNIKTISCVAETEKEEMDEDENGDPIMGIQGEITEYKYDTEKNELVEATSTMYYEFENASKDYIEEQAEDAESSCEFLEDEDSVKKCEVKTHGQKIELNLTADVDYIFDEEDDISKNSSFEDIEKFIKENSEDKDTVCTVK